jgi:hypothetical protein
MPAWTCELRQGPHDVVTLVGIRRHQLGDEPSGQFSRKWLFRSVFGDAGQDVMLLGGRGGGSRTRSGKSMTFFVT